MVLPSCVIEVCINIWADNVTTWLSVLYVTEHINRVSTGEVMLGSDKKVPWSAK